jgi:hypothetical protein
MSACDLSSYSFESLQNENEKYYQHINTNINSNENNVIYSENTYVNYMYQSLENNYDSVLYYSYYLNLYLTMIVWNLVFVILYIIYQDFIKYFNFNISKKIFYVLNMISIVFGIYLFMIHNMILFNLIIIFELLLISLVASKLFKINYELLLDTILVNMIIALVIQIVIMYLDICEPKILYFTFY